MNVPLLDLKAQYRSIKAEVLSVMERVCDEQGFVLGPRVVDFEKAMAQYVGSRNAIGCASGSDGRKDDAWENGKFMSGSSKPSDRKTLAAVITSIGTKTKG